MDARSPRKLTKRAVEPSQPPAQGARSAGAVEQIRDESQLVDAGAAGEILADATVEMATKDDARYVIYYSWPDDV